MSHQRSSDEPPRKPKTPHQELLEERRALLLAAREFQALAPWNWTSDDVTFGLLAEGASEPDWICVLGREEPPRALALHVGWTGFDLIQDMLTEQVDMDDVRAVQDAYLVTFQPKSTLLTHERAEIDASGIRFDAAIGFPVFERHLPGVQRSRLTTVDARRLRVALEQAIDVTRRVRDEGLVIDPEGEPRLFVRAETTIVADDATTDDAATTHATTNGATSRWNDARIEIPRAEPFAIPPIDAHQLTALRAIPLNAGACIQLDSFALAESTDRDGTTTHSFVTMIVDLATGEPCDIDVTATADRRYPKCRATLVQWMLRQSSIPRRIQVLRPDLADWIASVCEPMGIEVVVAEDLPELEEARAALEDGVNES